MKFTKITVMPIFLAFVSIGSLAEEYLLEFKEKCSAGGKELIYECSVTEDPKHYIFNEGGVWKARTLNNIVQATFKLLREDENVLVLEQTTVYSGNQVIYIMKKNGQFYLIQVAYSNILKNNETTTKQGIFIKTSE